MITLRRSEDRRHVRNTCQDTWMTFDHEGQGDPWQHGFHELESLNEDTLGPEMGLVSQPSTANELITYVHEGTLIHQDAHGLLGRLEAGEFQHRSARRGGSYRAINGSFVDHAHVFRSAITRDSTTGDTGDEQERFTLAERRGVLRLVGSEDGREASLLIHQDVRVYSSVLHVGNHLIHELSAGRRAWLHVVTGQIRLREEHRLRTGDGAAFVEEGAVSFTAEESSEVLLFDLPSSGAARSREPSGLATRLS